MTGEVTDDERLAFALDLQRRIDSTRTRIAETKVRLEHSRQRMAGWDRTEQMLGATGVNAKPPE